MMHRSRRSAALAVIAAAVAAQSAEAAVVVHGDRSVQGRLCAGGPECAPDEPFGDDTLRIKADRPRLAFTDTSRSFGYPTTDWALTAGGSGAGSLDGFTLSDVDAGTDPLRVLAGAPTDTLLVLPSGNVALRNGTIVQRVDATTMTAAAAADPVAVLTALANLPISTYAHPLSPTTTRIGPSAADFHAAFGLGDATGVAPSDVAGVALVAAKELAARLATVQTGGDARPPWGPPGSDGPPGREVAAAAHAANEARADLREAAKRMRSLERTHTRLKKRNEALAKKVKRLEKRLARGRR